MFSGQNRNSDAEKKLQTQGAVKKAKIFTGKPGGHAQEISPIGQNNPGGEEDKKNRKKQ